jgi:hypothetical protein
MGAYRESGLPKWLIVNAGYLNTISVTEDILLPHFTTMQDFVRLSAVRRPRRDLGGLYTLANQPYPELEYLKPEGTPLP